MIAPYLFFDGTCREAMTAYADILGGEILAMMSYAEAPADEGLGDMPADLVMHAAIRVDDQLLMASDDMPGKNVSPASTHVSISLTDHDSAKAAYDRLADGGEARMPFGKTFWSEGFGSVRDRWGTLWMVSVDSGT